MKKFIVLGIIVLVAVAGVLYYRSTASIQQSSPVGQNSAVQDTQKNAQDAVNTAIVAGTGLDKTYDDNGNTITLDIDSTVATTTYVGTEIGTHNSDTTSVHGIADTEALATKVYADAAVSTHTADSW